MSVLPFRTGVGTEGSGGDGRSGIAHPIQRRAPLESTACGSGLGLSLDPIRGSKVGGWTGRFEDFELLPLLDEAARRREKASFSRLMRC